jgi:hypothetical protein
MNRAPAGNAPVPDGDLTVDVRGPQESWDYHVYLPLVVKPEPPSPGDYLVVSWAQLDDGRSRDVLLHWRTMPIAASVSGATMSASALTRYGIDRREAGDTEWRSIGEAGFASNAAEMEDILGPDLVEQLGYDLSDDPKSGPLTAQEIYDLLSSDPALVQVLSQAYYQVGLAFGASFLDEDAPGGVTLEYQVRDLGPGGKEFEPAAVPSEDTDLHPPFSLREAWEGPDGLGQAPCDRFAIVPERYSWQTTSEYMPWDGRVYLIWDMPEKAPVGVGGVEGARLGMNIAGYRVYRSEHGLNRWSSINPQKAHCVTPALCETLVTAGPEPPDSAFPLHYFVDNLHESSPDPEATYGIWDYKVCAVDALRSDTECSRVLSVDVRELQPPIAVQNVRTAVPEDQSKVTVTWSYSDTKELSPPLRFYVTRSPTLTAPMEDWTVVKDKGSLVDYFEIRNTGPVTLSVTNYPPRDQVFWYRVQVRDDAGNWSAEGKAVEAARYTRTPPSLPRIPYDDETCERNDMPLPITELDDNVFIVNLYRSFDESGPFQLIERFEVTKTPSQNYVDINDDFLPPYPTYAYYRLEAVDDHGNVSAQQPYCAQLGGDPPVDPGIPAVTTSGECNEGGCQVITTPEDDATVEVQTTQPGEDGVPITSTETITGPHATDVLGDVWVGVEVSYPGSDDTFLTWERPLENEFLDTNRGLTALGPMNDVRWMTDTTTTPLEHYVRIRILDGPTPSIAVFRKAEHGNWMQIGPISDLGAYTYEDRSDPSPDEQYEYLVLALSPTTHELLGYWDPITLEPLVDDTPKGRLTESITRPDPIDPQCDQAPVIGFSTIYLHNGWWLKDLSFWIADDGDTQCPVNSRTPHFDSDHAYGSGTLTNGSEDWTDVAFYDIEVDGRTLEHTGGRIVATLDETRMPTGTFKISVQDVEFTADNVRAETDLRLPETIKVENDRFERTDTLFAVVPHLTTDFGFDPLTLENRIVVIDESLPWKLHTNWFTLDETELTLARRGREVTTTYRLASPDNPNDADSNLAFLRPTYGSDDAVITVDGLGGEFDTSDLIEYVTSFPADFLVTADGAAVSIAEDQILGGQLVTAEARLRYESGRTWYGRVVRDAFCNGSPRAHYSLCQGILYDEDEPVPDPVPRLLGINPTRDRAINVGPKGYLSGTVAMDQPIHWPSFSTDPLQGTLFIAPSTFPDDPTSWGPMPAEAAWQRLPNPDPGGDFDPGLNLNRDDETVNYFAYPDEPAFPGSAMDLYVRKGGVSGHLIMEDEGTEFRTNVWGYKDDPGEIEVTFVDNAGTVLTYTADLFLPYPTDAGIPVNVEIDPETNYQSHGSFREAVEVTHRYWALLETPRHTPANENDTEWVYADADTADYTPKITGVLTKVLQLQGSEAVVHGLQPPGATPETEAVTVRFNSEWLPDGDVGALRIVPSGAPGVDYRTGSFKFFLTSVKLSRYYSGILDHDSKPSTLGIDLADTMDELPVEILDDDGNLTGASLADCAATTTYGCGLIVLDGDVAVDYFGEVESEQGTRAESTAVSIPAVDELVGEFPMAVNYAILGLKFVGVQSGHVPWVWPVLNDVMDVDLPVKILGNTEGGIIVGLLRKAWGIPVFPGTEIFETDVAGVIDIRWNTSTGVYTDMVGVYLGYGASQAAFRALAMNRPRLSGGIRDYDQWSQVSADVEKWSDNFGYTRYGGSEDDPVDLAEQIWEEGWCNAWDDGECTKAGRIPYNKVFDVLEPVLKDMSGEDRYGGIGVEAGSALDESNISMNTTTLSAVFRYTGTGLEIVQLEGAGQVIWDLPEAEDPADIFFSVDWITFKMDRDGEIELSGDVHLNILDIVGDWGPQLDGHVHALATPVGTEWRFEGFVDVDPIGIAGLAALELDGTFGTGPYIPPGSSTPTNVMYFGGNVETYFLSERVGFGFLYGIIPKESTILREAGFGEILDTLGDQPTYEGFYGYLFAEVPVVEGYGCLLSATVGGEFRLWYWWSEGAFGGTLAGYAHATVGCVLSGRGQAELGYARLADGQSLYTRTCESSGKCDIFVGSLWAAVGVGWCSPATWHRWDDRWWGDSWCYCMGAYVDLSYMEPGGVDYNFDIDFE